MHRGYIKYRRCSVDNPLYFAEKFTRRQARQDLILTSNHKDGQIVVRGNIIHIKRGQNGYSEDTFAQRWKWSRNKVRRFLKHLETEQQIEQQKSKVKSIITVLNREKYQGNGTTDETTERHQTKQQTDTNKNDKNVKEGKEEIFEQFRKLYPSKKGKKKAMEFFAKKIKTQSDFDELLQGLENYKSEHNEKKALGKFVAERQQGDTFLSKETRKEYLEQEQDDETTFKEFMERYPEDYEYAHKLVAKRGEEKYLLVKEQVKKKNALPN